MIETIVTVLIVAAAGFWLYRWIRGTASGKTGCGCSGCEGGCASAKKDSDRPCTNSTCDC